MIMFLYVAGVGGAVLYVASSVLLMSFCFATLVERRTAREQAERLPKAWIHGDDH